MSVNTDKLEKLQRRAARIVMRLGSSEKALNSLGYVTLEKRRESHLRNIVKKCLSNAVHSSLCTILIITGMYCPEGQGAVINLDSRL